VIENQESTRRQYALQHRIVALGWTQQQIVVVDDDLGLSGTTAQNREGFQRLVAEVSLRHAGIVLGLEVSRLARNCADWYRLLEICAATGTLIMDEDGIYDPVSFNDRLVLGMKGTMSEAESHLLRARMRGGILNKAARGALAIPLPAGFVYDGVGRVQLDPDRQVQESVRLLFATFSRTGSAIATVRTFGQNGWKFPVRRMQGPQPAPLEWTVLTRNRVCSVLRNPRYAGTYVYGQNRSRRKVDGSGRQVERVTQQEWHTEIHDAHAGYLSWQEFEDNLHLLKHNALSWSNQRATPREGPALLQGLAYCGRCGARMAVRYHRRAGKLVPDYICHQRSDNRAQPACQNIPGRRLDERMGARLVEAFTPTALQLALLVEQEVQTAAGQAESLRQTHLVKIRYEARLAERRYQQVDPDNRLVAGNLEADWNRKLIVVRDAEQEYQRQRELEQKALQDGQREQILALARNFPALWRDPKTPERERKRMVQLLLEDVTLSRDLQQITAKIRFRGGATETLLIPIGKLTTQPKSHSNIIAEV
jgi:DNA invertase Pin-like site-specific DNA recombinase